MFGLFKSKKSEEEAYKLYRAIVEQARNPLFYSEYGVPDTVDGRFDMIVLHAHLVFDRLKDGNDTHETLSQAIFDMMFADMDQNLREMGVGDIGVAKRIRAMAEAFYGRATVYANALQQKENDDLEAGITKNLFRKSEPSGLQVATTADYVRKQMSQLAAQDLNDILKGYISFYEPRPVAGDA